MRSRIPVVATLVVLAAVATMIALGIWQLQRRDWKEAMIARYSARAALSSAVPWPRDPGEREAALFRHSQLDCAHVDAMEQRAGRNARGQSGWANIARCRLGDGSEAQVVLGWSSEPHPPLWSGGDVLGLVAPAGEDGVKLLASPPLAGLQPNAPPDPQDLPNNHLAYAVQWFLFALTAAVIYMVALRQRMRR